MDTLANFFSSADLCVWYGIRTGAYYIVFSMLFTPLMYVKTIEQSKTNARTQATQLSNVNTSMVRWACCQSRRQEKREKKTTEKTIRIWPLTEQKPNKLNI